MSRFEDDVAGMETVLDGVATGDSFAFGCARPGGSFGVTSVDYNLFCTDGHAWLLCGTIRSRILLGCCGGFVGGISVFVDSVARGLAPGFSLTIVALSGNPQQAVGHRPLWVSLGKQPHDHYLCLVWQIQHHARGYQRIVFVFSVLTRQSLIE